MKLPPALVFTIASLPLWSLPLAIGAAAPRAPSMAAAETEDERVDNLDALLDSAVELKDDEAILEAANQLLAIRPNHSSALENAIDVFIRRKDAVAARRFAERLVRASPDAAQSHLLYADACALRLPGESKEAASALIAGHLAEAKKLSVKAKDFDRQEDLAEAYDKSHQAGLARKAYLDLAAAEGTSATSRKEALARADEIAEIDRPHVVVTVSSLWEREGTLVGFDTDVYAGMWSGWLMGAQAHEDWLGSQHEPGHYEEGQTIRNDRQQAVVTARHTFEDAWQVDARVGADFDRETSPAAGLTVKKTTESDGVYKASLQANELASDSQLLVREGGRQQRAAVDVELPITKQLDVQIGGLLRKVDTDVGTLGWGAGATTAVEWHPLKNFRDLTVGYEWDYSKFHFDSGFEEADHPPLRDFIHREIDTHLGVIDLKHSFGDLSVDLRLAGGYAISQNHSEWDPMLTVSQRLSMDCRLSLSYEYDSADGRRVTTGDSHNVILSVNVAF